MTNTLFFSNRLDDSNGSIKVTHNNAMQSASQTTESPASAKKTPPPKRFGLLAVLAVGADAVASFLKSKMEKAAAVASQVGAAVLKSKQAVSAAVAAILVRIRPEPPKKSRRASAVIFALLAFALLAGIFIATPKLKASIGIPFYWTPWHDDHKWKKVLKKARRQPRPPAPPVFEWKSVLFEVDSSEYSPPYWALELGFLGSASSHEKIGTSKYKGYQTDHWVSGNVTYCFWRDENGRLQGDNCTSRMLSDGISLHYHRKYGQKATVWRYYTPPGTRVRFWNTNVYKLETSALSSSMKPNALIAYFIAVSEDGAHSGECDSNTFTSPGPEVLLTPCLPDNVRRNANVINLNVSWKTPPSDDEDE